MANQLTYVGNTPDPAGERRRKNVANALVRCGGKQTSGRDPLGKYLGVLDRSELDIST